MRSTGQAIELSTPAVRQIGIAMGLTEGKLREFGTGEQGLSFVDDNGKPRASFGVSPQFSVTSEFEILRSDLVDLIYQQTKDVVEYRFGDRVAAIIESSDCVSVEFEKGTKEDFTLVIVCDGLYSRTRKLAGFQNVDIRHLGLYTAFFTIEDEVIDMEDRYAKAYTMTGRRSLSIRPEGTNKTTRAYLSIMADLSAHRKMSVVEQKALLREKFIGGGYVVDKVLDGMDRTAQDFYMTELAQIRCADWSKDRVVLCGDAACCPSPMSGMGTDTAILTAYILAGELSKIKQDGDYQLALSRYEDIVRPFVDSAQKLPPGAPGIVHPDSKLAVIALRLLLRFVGLLKVSLDLFLENKPNFLQVPAAISSLFHTQQFELPEYPWDH